MKELIEKKLEDYAHSLVEKESLSCEDVNFLVFMLNRIEIKENQERDKEEREKKQSAVARENENHDRRSDVKWQNIAEVRFRQ